VGAVLVRRQIFLDAGRILPLWTRDDTRRQRHHRSNATAAVGASGPVYVWLTLACRGDFFHGKPVKLTLSPPPFIINSLFIKPLKVTFKLLIIIGLFLVINP
jgi:hypothetical protein